MDSLFKIETTEWELQTEDIDGHKVVPCHTRIVDGVLCRWWGDGPEPNGVKIIDLAVALKDIKIVDIINLVKDHKNGSK